MSRRLLAVAVALALPAAALADEGMWTYDNFPAAKVPGFAPDKKWLDHARLASARLANCSGAFVSADGLVMTNHHCARDCAQDLSTKDRDLVHDGFLARTRAEELRCVDERIDQLVAITDVTARVTGAVRGLAGDAYAQALAAERGRVEKECQTDARTRCETVSLYRGGLYHLYKYRRWDDVRLVFAPEEAVSFFGGDPDNYEFPRWNFDVSFMRIYEDGKPARPSDFMAWSKAGAREGETILISGHPGKTSRGMTVAQMAQQRDLVLPEELMRLAEQRGFLEEFQRRGDEERRTASAKLLGITNNLKRQRGQRRLLVNPAFFAERVTEEKALREAVLGSPELQARAAGAWEAIAGAVADFDELRRPYVVLEGVAFSNSLVTPRGFDSKLFVIARTLLRAAAERRKPSGERLRELQDASLPMVEKDLFSTAPIPEALEIATLTFSLSWMREQLGPDHPVVRRLLSTETPAQLAARVVRGTRLGDVAERRRLWAAESVNPAGDPMLALAAAVNAEARAIRKQVEDRVDGVLDRNGELVAAARFAVNGTSQYPDGTFTLRLAYGTVRSLPGVPAATTIKGLFERATGTAPLALPKRWLDAKAKLRADQPFNVIGTPDTTGGNSGSPVVNRAAEVVGIYFDQNVWGTGSAFGYDEKRRRGVYLDSGAIVEALEKVYGAKELVKEIRKEQLKTEN